MEGTCDCGEVTLRLARRPDRIVACRCAYCRRVGAKWGYFDGREVDVDGATLSYRRAARRLEFRRCEICGVLTHWQRPGRPAEARMGVNMALFEPAELIGIPVATET